jgi:UDP-N-acetylglucosamine:LPS N-acetylglucosamine transferase
MHPDPTSRSIYPRRSDPRLQPAAERVLVLTSGLGFGHVRAAQAIEAALLQRGATVHLLDLWSLINPGAASIIHQTYLRLVQDHTQLYERLYQLDEHTWRQILQSEEGPPAQVLEVLELISEIAADCVAEMKGAQYVSDRLLLSLLRNSLPYDASSLAGNGVRARLALMKWTWMRFSKRLEAVVSQFEPHAIVSTQMIPAAIISSLRNRHRITVPQLGVLTDYGLHDFWRQPGIDGYCIAHELLMPDADSDEDSGKMTATGVPLMPAFASPLSQTEARRQLWGCAARTDEKVVLVLGGGLGLSVDALAAHLLANTTNVHLLVMPGKNASVRSALSIRTADHAQRITVCDWTDRMDIFIRAADVVVGKPGGVSVAEVLACGRPLFATRSLGGQEGFNVRFLESHEVGGLVADAQLPRRLRVLFDEPETLETMQQRAWRLGCRDGAARVSELALDMACMQRPRLRSQEH